MGDETVPMDHHESPGHVSRQTCRCAVFSDVLFATLPTAGEVPSGCIIFNRRQTGHIPRTESPAPKKNLRRINCSTVWISSGNVWTSFSSCVMVILLAWKMSEKVWVACMLSSGAPEKPPHGSHHSINPLRVELKGLNTRPVCPPPPLWAAGSQCVQCQCVVCLCVWSMIVWVHWETLLDERVPQMRTPPRVHGHNYIPISLSEFSSLHLLTAPWP